MINKKRITSALVGAILLVGSTANADTFGIDNQYIKSSDTLSEMLPLRYAAENCGYAVEWNETDSSVLLSNGNRNIKISIGDKTYYSDGKIYNMTDAPKLIEDKTYITYNLALDIFNNKYITKQEEGYNFEDKPGVSADNMMQTVKEISMYPRSYFDSTHKDAMDYVINKFNDYGYITEEHNFDYSFFDWSENQDRNLSGTNIIAVKKPDIAPTGDVLIVGAHYDGVARVPAANDNGSGLSVMLELARVLKDLKTDTEIRFVAFDAEETGLNGSEEYVKTLKDERENIIGMINFDMLGAEKAQQFGVYSSDNRKNYLFDILNSCDAFRDIEFRKNMIGGSDHMSFATRVIPSISFSHESIGGEYHCANDIADNISMENLKKAADGGYYIISTIMSNLTPSYKEIVNSDKVNNTIDVNNETIIPTACTKEKFERVLRTELTQIPSENSEMKYAINVKLFDLENPFVLTVDGQAGSEYIANPHIDIESMDIEKIKSVLDKNIGNPIENNGNYFYNTIYGNCYVLYHDKEEDTYTLAINDYWDYDKEAYEIKEGKILRLDNPDLTVKYELSKINGKINVTETKAQPSGEEVSDRMSKCMERLKPYLSELGDIDYIVLKTDGIGNSAIHKISNSNMIKYQIQTDDEIADEYKNLPEHIQHSAQEAESRLAEGETATIYIDNMDGNKLFVDSLDLLNEKGRCYTKKGLLGEIAMIKANSIFTYDENFDKNAVKSENLSRFEECTWNFKKGGYLYKFAEKFYQDIYSTDTYNSDLYIEYPGEFVNEDAALNIELDIQNSFSVFVAEDKPLGGSIAEEKIRFFYDYPELTQVRDTLRDKIK